MFEQTKKFCDSFLKMGVPGFDLAVLQHGKCVLRYSNGYADLENQLSVTGKERYNIYSCSKVITCTAALQLWEKGLYSLEDDLGKYMPEFAEMTVQTEEGLRKAEKPILIKHLFEMTAGFSYDFGTPHMKRAFAETEGRCPTREVMKYLAQEPLLFEPGERWNYSLCHDVLAAFVEVIAGEKFEDYVQKNIFDVAGMKDSTFMLPEAELETVAEQYRFANGKAENVGKQIVTHKFGTEYASGGAGCISTVEDYLRFLEGLRTYKLLKPETLKLMTTPRLTEEQNKANWTRNSHGYGLGVRCPNGNPLYTDFGWSGAAGAFLALDMANGISLYFATHLLASPAQELSTLMYRFVRAELLDMRELEELRGLLKEQYHYELAD